MTSKGGEVHGVLSFAIGLISDEGRVALQHQFSTVIQAHPTFRIEVDAFENGLIVRGDDELELMEIREKITPEYEANIGELTISYKESIRRPAEAEGKYIRQTGGSGNYGHAKIRLEPNEPGKDVEFINEIKGDVVPKNTSCRLSMAFAKLRWAGFWPATRSWISRRFSTTAAITKSTRTKWRSRSPARWRSRKPRERRTRCC